MKSTTVVNLFGGPGSGKSTTAAGVFHALKQRGISVEMAHEYAKDLCWEENPRIAHQLSVFAEQHWRLFRLVGKVDFIVTDSPLLLSLVYAGGMMTAFRKMVIEEHHRFKSLNLFIERVKSYQPEGRYQDEAGARAIDDQIRAMLLANEITHPTIPGDHNAALYIATMLSTPRGKK